MIEPATPAKAATSFGPFKLVPSERLLTREGAAVPLGARTFDTLMALVSFPNEVVSKRDLMTRVWPDVTVEEGSLRFHIAELRKALGDGKDGARYIATVAGRGYCFVAPISHEDDRRSSREALTPSRTNLPGSLQRMIGREDVIPTLSAQLVAARLVTIVGSGGVGKTTIAIAVAQNLLENFAGDVLFVDFGALSGPDMVSSTLASLLGLTIGSGDSIPSLVAFLRDKRMLLILDNCEHVIEAAAALATKLLLAAPHVHILTTSREALRVPGERVFKLSPLAFPPDDTKLTAAAVFSFPAAQLFVERVAAIGTRLDRSDQDAAIVASLCRQLDGVPLAIELAAGRVEAYGLEQTAMLLDQRLSQLWQGRRTAPRRQQTLRATLDWSYELLSELERVVLHRLAVFVADFTIEAALAVATDTNVDQSSLFRAVDSLVAKSMVATSPLGARMRYRLHQSTRAYALEINDGDVGLAALYERHAVFYRLWLEQIGTEWPTLSNIAESAPHLANLGNVRAALQWCFSPNGNSQLGISLASAAAPVFLAMSLLSECRRWSEQAIVALDGTMRNSFEEMQLQKALGLSLMFTLGNSDVACDALNRALTVAEQLNDLPNQLELLGRLHMFYHRSGNQTAGLQYAKRGSVVSKIIAEPAALALGHSLLGITLSYVGAIADARTELEAALQYGQGPRRTRMIFQGVVHYTIAGAYLGRTLWLQGCPTQAIQRAHKTVKDAASMDHPVTLCIALMWATSVLLWTGDLEAADNHANRFIAHAKSHSLTPYLAVGRGLKAELAIQRGDAKGGVEDLKQCLEELHAARYGLLTTTFNISLIHGLLTIGRFNESMTLIDETIRLVEVNGDLVFMPELLRVKGNALLTLPQPSLNEAERCFSASLEWSRRQGALAWELRTAIDLAKLFAEQERNEDARALLQPLFERFEQGSETSDLRIASKLLALLKIRCG
jgi:predicted ATPase/DNA-binding winged helix-turn-helix (wHTH) protein